MPETTGSLNPPSTSASTNTDISKASASTNSPSTSRLRKLGWRWVEIIAIPIALVASIGAYWEAKSTADAVADQRRATAEQVLILGPTAPKLTLETPGA